MHGETILTLPSPGIRLCQRGQCQVVPKGDLLTGDGADSEPDEACITVPRVGER